jgi:hypothetical protein
MSVPELTFLLVGAGKAASTRIFGWLDEHPQICMARPKEPQFFSCYFGEGPEAFWPRFFQHFSGEPHVGEATPGYLHLPYVPGRIRATYPEAKILMCLPDPIDRAHTDWWMSHARGDDPEDFERAMRICLDQSDRSSRDPEQSWIELRGTSGTGRIRARPYLEIGLYDEHLARYREYFDEVRIKVLLFDDLLRDPRAVYADICRFLGLREERAVSMAARNPAMSRALARARHLRHSRLGGAIAQWVPASVRTGTKDFLLRRAAKRPPIPPKTKAWLREYYAPHNDRLARALDRDLSHWGR